MKRAGFRFYAELNDLIRSVSAPAGRVELELPDGATVRDALEAVGVPLERVELVLVNGASARADHLVEPGDRVSVFPVFEALDVASLARLRPRPLRELRFLVPRRLGRLALWLRLFGFDAATQIGLLGAGDRILLSTDPSEVAGTERGLVLSGRGAREQLRELVRRLDLAGMLAPGTRCPRCNLKLEGERCPGCTHAPRWSAPLESLRGRMS